MCPRAGIGGFTSAIIGCTVTVGETGFGLVCEDESTDDLTGADDSATVEGIWESVCEVEPGWFASLKGSARDMSRGSIGDCPNRVLNAVRFMDRLSRSVVRVKDVPLGVGGAVYVKPLMLAAVVWLERICRSRRLTVF